MHLFMQSLLAAIRDWTCLGPGREAGPEAAAPPSQIAGLAWLGIPAGCLVAAFYYPLASLLLPPDVVLTAALCVQAFLLSFHAEAGLASLASHRSTMPRGPGAVTLAILMKVVLYRQFFPEEAARLLLLGTVVSFAGPALLAISMRKRGEHAPPFAALLPLVGVTALVSALAARAPSDLPPAARAVVGGIGILACISLARIVVTAFVRERRTRPEGVAIFAASLPCEIAAIGGYLLVRFT